MSSPDEVVVETTEAKLRELLDGELDSVTLEVISPGIDPVPLANVDYDMQCNIAGIVREIDDINEFTRSDGETGYVRNIRLQDSTSTLRVALWGEQKANIPLELGDPVVCRNVEIQDGWQDEIEASANWNSEVEKLDEQPVDFVRVTLTDDEDTDTDEDGDDDE